MFDLAVVQRLFAQKCGGKELTVPSAADLLAIVGDSEELRSEWENMLEHQLPTLPRLDDLLRRLPDLLAWMDRPEAILPAARLVAAPAQAGTVGIAPAGIQYWGGGSFFEAVRFAGANRLMISFNYDGKRRLVEPYSLRRAATGNVLLYAWERGSTHIKAFNTAKIQNLSATNQSFRPRHRVEFSTPGPLSIPDAARSPSPSLQPALAPRRRTRSRRSATGPTHIFECPNCERRFKRSSNKPALGKHKTRDGWPCPGRQGFLVEVR